MTTALRNPKPAAIAAAALSATPVVEIGTLETHEENPTTHHDEHSADGTTFVSDPVCGMKIDPKAAAATREHDGVTFYFCSLACVATFDADPHRYGYPHATH